MAAVFGVIAALGKTVTKIIKKLSTGEKKLKIKYWKFTIENSFLISLTNEMPVCILSTRNY